MSNILWLKGPTFTEMQWQELLVSSGNRFLSFFKYVKVQREAQLSGRDLAQRYYRDTVCMSVADDETGELLISPINLQTGTM